MSYVKQPAETKLIAEGGKLMGEILEKLAAMVKPGITGLDIDNEAERLILAAGGVPAFRGYRGRRGDPPFPSVVCFSVNHELVHGIATKEKVIKNGDIVSIDIGMEYPNSKFQIPNSKHVGGYFTDTAVTITVGKVPKEIEKLLNVTKEALEAGIRAAKVGNTVADIGRAVETYVNHKATTALCAIWSVMAWGTLCTRSHGYQIIMTKRKRSGCLSQGSSSRLNP